MYVLRIGGNAVYGDYFNGLIDEVRVYSRALNQGEIRSDMSTPVSRTIDALEIQGLHLAKTVLVLGSATADVARRLMPDFALKIAPAADSFPAANFQKELDAGAVKARYLIGPVGPTILFVGVMDEDHGPDLLIKAVPAILKNALG